VNAACNCIDVHTHVVPENFPRYAGRGTDVPWPQMEPAHACHRHVVISGKHYRTVNDGAWSAPRRLEAMARMQVERQVLSPMPELMSYWLPLDDAAVLVRYINEEIARLVAIAPDRFTGLGGVALQDTDTAIRELEYVTGKLGFAGVEIASHVNGVSIGDPRFEPFFARAAALGAAVFVHALRPAGKERVVGAFPEQAVCFPGDIALAATSMITSGVAARHPSLRIAFSHGGGAMAMLLPRLVQAWKAVPKARESLAQSPAVYARQFFYDTLVFSPAALQFLVATMGAGQVLVGSDFPFGLSDEDPVASLQAAGFDAATTSALLRGNAQRFLNLETSA
jgi:aminocarboxymuconate-semialdehyde decarboxylase